MRVADPRKCPYYLVSRVTLAVTQALKLDLQQQGLDQIKPAYFGVLMALWRTDDLRTAELGKLAGLEPSSMTGLLDRMERDGLVLRQTDPQDRRAQRIRLTELGRGVRDPVLATRDRVMRSVFEGIDRQALEQSKEVLRSVLCNVQKGVFA